MKKLVLAMVFAASIFSGTTLTTQAEEQLNIAEVVYPNADKTEYYSLQLVRYASNYKKFSKDAPNIEHVRLTNNESYRLIDYASMYLAAAREGKTNVLSRGLNKLTTTKTPQNIKIIAGKFENGRVVAAEEVTETFRVVEIK